MSAFTALSHLRDAGLFAAAAVGLALYFRLRAWPPLQAAETIGQVIARKVQDGDRDDGRLVAVTGIVAVVSGVSSFLQRRERATPIEDAAGRSLLWFESSSIGGQRFWVLDDGTGHALPARNCSSPQRLSPAELDQLLDGQGRGRRHGATALLDAVLGLAGASRFRGAESPPLELYEGFARRPLALLGGERVTLVGRACLPEGFTTLFIDGWAFAEHAASRSDTWLGFLGWPLPIDPVTLVLFGDYAVRNPAWVVAVALAAQSIASLLRAWRALESAAIQDTRRSRR